MLMVSILRVCASEITACSEHHRPKTSGYRCATTRTRRASGHRVTGGPFDLRQPGNRDSQFKSRNARIRVRTREKGRTDMLKRIVTAIPGALAALALSTAAIGADTVTAVKVAQPPKLAAGAADPAWANAKPLSVPLTGGKNFKAGSTTATLKVVYSGDMLYLLLQYDDPTQSVQRSPFQKQADGKWIKLKDPEDQGGDNNKVYEDKFAFIWNVNNSIKGFNEQGCMVACHVGEAGKTYGNKYTASAGEIGDIWHMKSIRTGYIGQT